MTQRHCGLTRVKLKAIICGLIHDGLDVRMLTPTGREEIKRALDILLEQAKRLEDRERQ